MTTEQAPTNRPERRASDALPSHFANEALDRIDHAHPAFADAHIESIDLDAVLPPGHGHDDDEHFAPAATLPDREENKARLEIVRFKGSLNEFAVSKVTRVDISDIKRGDVIAIKTIVGSIYFRILDRIKGVSAGAGEILCECRYDLPNQYSLIHGASIVLPVCTKSHVITNPDGSQRKASRALKMVANTELPEQVKNLLRESFFVEMQIYATPQQEKLRPVDVVRGIKRMALKLKGGSTKP